MNKGTSAITLIVEERAHQIQNLGFTTESDLQKYKPGDLAIFAQCCITGNFKNTSLKFPEKFVQKLLTKPYTERLVIAAALLAAEIDYAQSSGTSFDIKDGKSKYNNNAKELSSPPKVTADIFKKESKEEQQVFCPNHYDQYPIEVIDMMIMIWGADKVSEYCTINAFKYRMRAGHKNPVEVDLAKEKWYLEMSKILKNSKIK